MTHGRPPVAAVLIVALTMFHGLIGCARSKTTAQTQPSAIAKANPLLGLWFGKDTEADKSESMTLFLFKPDGTGVYVGIGGNTALGARFDYMQDGQTITISPQSDTTARPIQSGPKRTMLCRLANGQLVFHVREGKTVTLTHTEDDKYYEYLQDENPRAKPRKLPPEARAMNPPGSELTARYYELGATEAALTVGGENIFEIGDEAAAPQTVRDKLAALREVARPRLAKLEQPEFDVSPDGRMIIMHGFAGRESLTYIWNDWRKPEDVRELKLYFRGGGRFINNRYIYMGNRVVFDRMTGKQYPVPNVDVLNFDVNSDGHWVGLSEDRRVVRLGSLGSAEKPLEIPLGAYGDQPMWIDDGRHFAVEIIQKGLRVYSADGAITDTVTGKATLGPRLGEGQLFVATKSGSFVLARTDERGKLDLGKPCFATWRRPDVVSPSKKYVACFNSASASGVDRFEVWRTPRATDNNALPPRVPMRPNHWISWATDEQLAGWE